MTVQWIGIRVPMAMMVAIGLLAVLTAGAATTHARAQGPPLLLFASDRAPDYYPEVYSLDLAAGVPRNVSLSEHSDQLAELRGGQVVFASDRDGQALYTAPLGKSGAARRLLRLPRDTAFEGATWSPSGQELAVTLAHTQDADYSIELVDRSGRKLALLAHASTGPSFLSFAAARGRSLWSADGKRLAYRPAALSHGRQVIRIVDGRGRLRFSRPASSAIWAQAAARVALVNQRSDTSAGSTVAADEQGRTIRRFAGEAVALSPDGETLVLARGTRALWLASVSTGKLQRLPSGVPAIVAVSPNGEHLELQFDTGLATLIVSMSSGRVEAHLPAFGTWFADSRRLAIIGPSPPNVVTLATVNGRLLRRIRLAADGDYVPALAITQDGTMLAYTAQSSPVHQIYAQLPSGELRQITHDTLDHTSLAASPDGQTIADIEHDTPCGNCVPQRMAVLPADGSTPPRMLSSGEIDSHPTWSPDGTHIAYTTSDPTGSRILVMRADGSQPTELATGTGGNDPSWAPDGSAIAMSREGIFVMTSDGTSARRLTEAIPTGSQPSKTRAPTWSPDSTTLAFAGADGLYLVGRDGSGLRRIIATPGITSVAWSPDGALIAFAAACQNCPNADLNDIWTVHPDGSDLNNVISSLADDTTPTWLPQP